MAGVIAASLKKKSVRRPDEKIPFYTPARYGWGHVARELHPQLARVGQTTFNVEKTAVSTILLIKYHLLLPTVALGLCFDLRAPRFTVCTLFSPLFSWNHHLHLWSNCLSLKSIMNSIWRTQVLQGNIFHLHIYTFSHSLPLDTTRTSWWQTGCSY